MTSPYFDNGVARLYHGDCREIPLNDESVHCVVTSPPYYALRVYADLPGSDWGDDWHGCLGNEPEADQYLTHLIECFREVKRVLRDDGILWVNISDTRGGGRDNNSASAKQSTNPGANNLPGMPNDLSLTGIPERFALAMQADGWTWRDTIIWAKKSSMPESLGSTRWEQCRVKVEEGGIGGNGNQRMLGKGRAAPSDRSILTQWADCPGCAKCEGTDGLVLRRGSWRCTSSFEYLYMFVKGSGYYSDGDAVKTVAVLHHTSQAFGDRGPDNGLTGYNMQHYTPSNANRRNVWNDIRPEPYGGPHYATFPSDLPRLCIQASTSAHGVCPECGAQLARVVAVTQEILSGSKGAGLHTPNGNNWEGVHDRTNKHVQTLGWRAICSHGDLEPVPALVCDPFAGTATTLIAAQRLGRRGIGMELSLSYLEQAKKRLAGITLPMGV